MTPTSPSDGSAATLRTVSVALCTYQSTRFLEPQLRSILEQDYPVTEVVIADDGSTDGTVDLIDRLKDELPGGEIIRVVATERVGGFSKNFERAISACTSDVIVLSDHDDVWLPHRLSHAITHLGPSGSRSLVFSNAELIDDNGRRLPGTLFGAYDVSERETSEMLSGDAFHALLRRNIVTGATVMFESSLLSVAFPVGHRWIHDEWLAIMASAVGTIHMISEPLIQYRLHGSNQIGVPPRSKVKRTVAALKAGSPRFHLLRDRAGTLVSRLEASGAPQRILERARAKLEFEHARCRYTRIPVARYGRISVEWRAGKYHEFTPFPELERWRDLLQSP
ncbi:glycosyltransferase family 2 protein [Demequina sp.]|uniref:glycosyltransferase family 2 protein n=1 Tax=Demequina sp. TaxID=2050685 RepID=UPI0025BBC516|nr:glycosyltransferase family 2 protein [Demequina sp.]